MTEEVFQVQAVVVPERVVSLLVFTEIQNSYRRKDNLSWEERQRIFDLFRGGVEECGFDLLTVSLIAKETCRDYYWWEEQLHIRSFTEDLLLDGIDWATSEMGFDFWHELYLSHVEDTFIRAGV